jgi:uncharacterized iron-regulated membrane protein
VRKLVFSTHLVAAFAAGAVLTVLSLSGVLLLFEQNMDAWLTADLHVAPSGQLCRWRHWSPPRAFPSRSCIRVRRIDP